MVPRVGDDAAVLGVEAGTMRETSSWLETAFSLGKTYQKIWKTQAFGRKMI